MIQSVGDLRPQGMLFSVVLLLLVGRTVIFQPSPIPMDVDDGIHVVGHTVAHHLIDTIQPALTNLMGLSVFDVLIPRTGNADGIETKLFDLLNICVVNPGVPPGCLPTDGFERIPNIPACIHFGRQYKGITFHPFIWHAACQLGNGDGFRKVT